MPYNPPSCSAVNFTLLPIFIPVCSAVNFNIGGSDVGITIHESVINIYNDTWYYVEGYFINVDVSYLNIYSDELQFQTLSEIGGNQSVINITSDVDLLQILPDCISHESTIHVNSDTINIRAGQVNDLPFKLSSGGLNIPWGGNKFFDEFTTLKWEDGTKVDDVINLDIGGILATDHLVNDGWGVIDFKDNVTNIPWDKLNFADHSVLSPWNTLIITDKERNIKYGNKYEISNIIVIPYLEPGAKDVSKLMEFASASNQITYTISVPWGAPGPQDRHQLVPWGPLSYYPFCTTKYFPITDGIVNFKLEPQDPEMVGVCFQVTFDVEGYNTDPRCYYKHHHTGRRDPYISGIPIVHVYPPGLKETYTVLNTILVKRLPDNVPIEVLSVSIKYDNQSYTWQFSVQIPKNTLLGVNYLELIKPNPGNLNIFTDIEIYINGWRWVCRVESYSESRIFAKDTWSVSGRSPSMELGSPINQRTSYTYDQNGTDVTAGVQIIEAVLDGTMLNIDNTGWSLNLDYYHGTTGIDEIFTGFDPEDGQQWGIPANTFTWTNLTQIEVIKQLADSIGAFIYTEPNCTGVNKILYLKPLINKPPWKWNDVGRPTINHAIRSSYCTEAGRSYESLPVYTSVLVMGQSEVEPQQTNITSGIVVADVYRFGPDRIYAPDLVNPWITTFQAAAELGRVVLSDTGEWIKHTLRLLSLEQKTNPTPQISGLIVPGDFVSVEENSTTWYGLTTSTEIVASSSGRGAFTVYQNIEVKQYIGA